MGVSWSSPRPIAATFLLGPVGFPCWVPVVRQKPRGLPLPQPCLGSQGPTAREVPAPTKEQSKRTAGGEGKGRVAGTCIAQTGFLCSAPQWWMAAHLPTSHVPAAPCRRVLHILRLMVRTEALAIFPHIPKSCHHLGGVSIPLTP